MPPVPHRLPVALDPTSSAFVDGMSCTVCGDDVIVYGGSIGDRIWRMHLPSATWTEIPCIGMVPPPRFFHAAAHCNGFLIVCGGELIVPDQYSHPERVVYYELDLESYEWRCLDTFDDVPMNRSHHTLTSLPGGKEVVLFGGKPIPAGVSSVPVANRILSSRNFHDSRKEGFYDIFVLYPLSRTWRRINMFDPLSPVLWGHSATLYQNSHILFCGGCDVSQTDWRAVGTTNANTGAYYVSDEPPVASLSNTMHVMALDTFQWQQHEVMPKDPGPVPRALHFGDVCCDEAIVFGGFTINRLGGVVTATDCWLWSIRRGTWQRIEFCVPQWGSKKLLSVVYGTQWLVMPSLETVFFMEMTKIHLGWQRASSKVQALVAPPGLRSDVVLMALPTPSGPNQSGVFPPHRYLPTTPARSTDPSEVPFDYRSPTANHHHPTDDGEGGSVGANPSSPPYRVPVSIQDGGPVAVQQYVESLRDEVRQLREELSFATSSAFTSHTVEYTVPRTDASKEAKLMRWSAYQAPTTQGATGASPANLTVTTNSSLHHASTKRESVQDAQKADTAKSPKTAAKESADAAAAATTSNEGKQSKTKDDDTSSVASDSSHLLVQPRFVDRNVIDKATRRKLEVFRKLQAKADRNVKATEHALMLHEKLAAGAPTNKNVNDPASVPGSSDSENEDIYRVADLGIQLHRAVMNNSESKRQLLFRERRRRIEQLQDRLRALEGTQQPHQHLHHHRSGSSASGSPPDAVKNAVDLALRHSTAIQRMMEAHELGLRYETDSDRPNHSAGTSVAVMVPNTHELRESLRSSSLSSFSPSDHSGTNEQQQSATTRHGTDYHADGGEVYVEPPTPTSEQIATFAAAPMERHYSVLSDMSRVSRQASIASQAAARQQLRTSFSSAPPTAHAGDMLHSSFASDHRSRSPIPEPAVPPVYRAQRPRSKTSVQHPAAAGAVVRTPSATNVSSVASAVPPQSVEVPLPTRPSAAVPFVPASVTAPTAPVITQLPSPAATAAVSPTDVSLQNKWDILQAALLAKPAGPRRAFVASDI